MSYTKINPKYNGWVTSTSYNDRSKTIEHVLTKLLKLEFPIIYSVCVMGYKLGLVQCEYYNISVDIDLKWTERNYDDICSEIGSRIKYLVKYVMDSNEDYLIIKVNC